MEVIDCVSSIGQTIYYIDENSMVASGTIDEIIVRNLVACECYVGGHIMSSTDIYADEKSAGIAWKSSVTDMVVLLEDKIKQLNDAIVEYDDKANAGTGSGDDPGK